jgi:hypothetical protein
MTLAQLFCLPGDACAAPTSRKDGETWGIPYTSGSRHLREWILDADSGNFLPGV